MTVDRLKLLIEFLREFRLWLEDERPGSIDGSIASWCETVAKAEAKAMMDAAR
jgi:hypothetical protein